MKPPATAGGFTNITEFINRKRKGLLQKQEAIVFALPAFTARATILCP